MTSPKEVETGLFWRCSQLLHEAVAEGVDEDIAIGLDEIDWLAATADLPSVRSRCNALYLRHRRTLANAG